MKTQWFIREVIAVDISMNSNFSGQKPCLQIVSTSLMIEQVHTLKKYSKKFVSFLIIFRRLASTVEVQL